MRALLSNPFRRKDTQILVTSETPLPEAARASEVVTRRTSQTTDPAVPGAIATRGFGPTQALQPRTARPLSKAPKAKTRAKKMTPLAMELASRSLLNAASWGMTNEALQLIEEGAPTHCRTSKGETCLHMAIDSNKPELVEAMLQHDPSLVDVASADGMTPLMLAIKMKAHTIVRLLLTVPGPHVAAARSEDGATALHLAVESGDVEAARAFVEVAGEANLQAVPDRWGATPLAIAVETGNDALIEVLRPTGTPERPREGLNKSTNFDLRR